MGVVRACVHLTCVCWSAGLRKALRLCVKAATVRVSFCAGCALIGQTTEPERSIKMFSLLSAPSPGLLLFFFFFFIPYGFATFLFPPTDRKTRTNRDQPAVYCWTDSHVGLKMCFSCSLMFSLYLAGHHHWGEKKGAHKKWHNGNGHNGQVKRWKITIPSCLCLTNSNIYSHEKREKNGGKAGSFIIITYRNI